MRVIFVTAVGGDIGSSVLKSLRSSFPLDRLVGCDVNEYNQGIGYLDEFYIAPAYTYKQEYMEFVKTLCLEKNITHFVPMTEPEIKIINENRDFFQKNGIKVLIHNANILDIALDKYKTAVYLRKNGVPVPKTWLPIELEYPSEFPVVVKGRQGCGSKNLAIVHSKEEYVRAIERIENPVVQEYVGTEEEEYTVGIFSNKNQTEYIAFKRKLGYGGMSIQVELVEDTQIEHISMEVAKLFDLAGSINIQMRKEKGNYYIFEINPRISSTVGFRNKLGFHDIEWWFRLLDHGCERIEYKKEEKKVIGIRVLEEKIFYID